MLNHCGLSIPGGCLLCGRWCRYITALTVALLLVSVSGLNDFGSGSDVGMKLECHPCAEGSYDLDTIVPSITGHSE